MSVRSGISRAGRCYNAQKGRKMAIITTALIKATAFSKPYTSNIGKKEPVAHPKNCRHECPYGYDRTFCFPCYAKIMADHKERCINARG